MSGFDFLSNLVLVMGFTALLLGALVVLAAPLDEVAAIEVDGLCDEIAKLLATYPNLPERVVRQISRAVAELIGAQVGLAYLDWRL